MTDALTIIPFGGCQINGPMKTLYKEEKAISVYRRRGFKQTPFAFTPLSALQLLDFCEGVAILPDWVRYYSYADPLSIPDATMGKLAPVGSAVLLEPNTPVNVMVDGYVLNQTLLGVRLIRSISERFPDLKKVAVKWRSQGLLGGNDAVRAETSILLLKGIPEEPEWASARHVIENARINVDDVEQIMRRVGELRERIQGQLGIVLYTYQFLPDGRTMSWPRDFKQNVWEAAMRLNLPLLEPAVDVVRHGVQEALNEDLRHHNLMFRPVIAPTFFAFAEKVLNGAKFEEPDVSLLPE